MTLSGATNPGQSGSGSDGNEGVHSIHQSSSITGTSPPDGLMSYTTIHLGKSYASTEKQSVYFTVPQPYLADSHGISILNTLKHFIGKLIDKFPSCYNYHYYYCSLIRAFHVSNSRWFFTEV